ncbi:PTS sugar transporter subunit IIA [Okibacterium endophyticum]
MALPPLPDNAVTLRAHASDWRAAVSLAGEALENSGSTGSGYTQRMIDVIDEFGAYVVIAPGLALAHARPGSDVLHEGISVVTLDEGVHFGHPHNDPVNVVLGLAVTTAESHVTSIAELANVFNDSAAIPALAASATLDDVRAVLFGGAQTGAGEHNAETGGHS